jgi:CubicO group peptidase (beta-lactamase class C family)
MKRLLTLIGAGASVVAAAVAWDWPFLYRYATFTGDPMTVPVAWFQPKDIVAGGNGDDPPAVAEGMAAIDGTALESAAQFAQEQNSSALIVLRRGRIEFERYWDGADRSTPHNPQSMSKTVLGLVMGAALADRKIGSVDDPISKYLTEWAGQTRGAIPVRQMLSMASGLEHMSSDYTVRLFSKANRYNFGTDFVSYILDLDLEGQPGARFDYNDDNTNLLGLAIERATGRRYAEYLSEKIWRPIGNHDAGMYLDRADGATMKSCCIFSRPMDWAKLGLLVLGRGQWDGKEVVPSAWVDAMTAPSPGVAYYGFQIWRAPGDLRLEDQTRPDGSIRPKNASEPFIDDQLIFMNGHGYQRVWISRKHDLVVVRFGRKWPAAWDETRIPNAVIRGIRAGM